MNNGFITQMKDKNGDSWYHQIVVETQKEEIEELKAEIHDLNDSVTWWTNRANASERDKKEYKQRIDKALKHINFVWNNTQMHTDTVVALRVLENILRGELDE